MQPSTNIDRDKGLVSVLELKRLLLTVTDNKLPVSFRYRLLGEMWKPNFMNVLRVTEKGVLLKDEVGNKLISVLDLTQIVQFEIDQSIHNFEPHFHYGLVFEFAP